MSRTSRYEPEFVDAIPEQLAAGVLYISIPYTTAAHLCACGCGREVITPIRPRDWRLTFDGESVSLEPSIGNWSFHCQSHYYVTRNKVRWAQHWTPEQIASARSEAAQLRQQVLGPGVRDEAEAPRAKGVRGWLAGKFLLRR